MAPSGSQPPSDRDETSYVEMSARTLDQRALVGDPDATLIGKHCQHTYCNQLDFLPFVCQSCHKTFCSDHRTEDGHSCAQAGAWAARRRAANAARPAAGEGKTLRDRDLAAGQKPCAFGGGGGGGGGACNTVVGTSLVPGVHCEGCNRDYCLKHRLREEHECAKLVPVGARPMGRRPAGAGADFAKGALEKLRLWGAARVEAAGRSLPKAKPSSAAQRLAATNNLKKSAQGDAKVPPAKRVYLFVEAEAETARAKIPKGEFFYSKDWVIGRVLDAAARSLQVQNMNNQSADEKDKLRMFHVEGGRLLDFKEKVGACLTSGNTIVLLRGIGPPVPDLIKA